MDFIFADVTYELITASDVIRDGLGIELWNKDKHEMIAEIFRNDNLKKIEFFSVECRLPIEVLEFFISQFEKRVGREYQD
jgi:hypothetical protein